MAKVTKSTDSSSLAEVVDRNPDKGLVVDAFVKASVEPYLKYAEAIGLTASAATPA